MRDRDATHNINPRNKQSQLLPRAHKADLGLRRAHQLLLLLQLRHERKLGRMLPRRHLRPLDREPRHRVQGYRYTEWAAWTGTQLAPDWSHITIGDQIGWELYDHRSDSGVSADSFSGETANIAETADPALVQNLSTLLHQVVAAQRVGGLSEE